MSKLSTPKNRRAHAASLLALLALCASLLAAPAALTQTGKRPITRKGLVDAVRINGLSTAELVQHVQRRGVDFEMTPDAEQELNAAGARPEVVEAARNNYRRTAAAATTTTAPNTVAAAAAPGPARSTSGGRPVPPGQPLSKNEIVMMLQGGSAPERVEQFVEARGVTFTLTQDISREITAAGGNRSLLGAISEKAPSDSSSTSTSPNLRRREPAATANTAPDYDDYIDRISSSIAARHTSAAVRYAQEAIQQDPSQPTAYSLLGFAQLYLASDINAAEQAFRAAIERGGSARFAVYHDHGGTDFAQHCVGSFFVTKTGVSFKANDGRHTFETEDSNIKEAKTNNWVGLQYGAFHIKPVQKINDTGNFNFAPFSRQRIESQLLLRLIKEY